MSATGTTQELLSRERRLAARLDVLLENDTSLSLIEEVLEVGAMELVPLWVSERE